MADDLRLEADASQYVAELNKAVEALNRLHVAQENTVKQSQSINTATGKVQSALAISAGEAGKSAAIFQKVGKEWQLVSNTISTSTKELTDTTKNLNSIAAAASRTAIKMGDFTKATAAANLIQRADARQKALEKVATAQVQQPIATEQFTRNLRRGFEKDIEALPLAARKSFKEIERQFAETGAQLGLTWDKFSKKFQSIQAGKLAIAPEGDAARLQAAGLAYANQIEKIKRIREKNAQEEAAAAVRRATAQRAGDLEVIKGLQDRTKAEREMYFGQQANATKDAAAQLGRAKAFRGMHIEQKQEEETLTKVQKAQRGYAELNDKINAGLLTVTKTTANKTFETGKSIETLRVANKAGESYIATITRMDGVIKGFSLQAPKRASELDTIQAVQAPIETIDPKDYAARVRKARLEKEMYEEQQKAIQQQKIRAEQARQETAVVQSSNAFYKQLGQTHIELEKRKISLNLATGESIERYRTLDAKGQEVITTIAKQGQAVKGMTQDFQEQTRATRSLTLSWQSMIRIFTIQVLHQAVSALTSAMQQAVETAKNLQINVAQIQTISESGFGVDKWAKGILEVSNATGLLAEDVARGTYDTLSNQIADGATALDFMAKAGNFAVTTNSTLQESVNALSSAINSYGLTTQDTTRISDIFFRMIDLGRIQAKDFSNEIGRILPGAQQLGVRLEEVAAVLSTLTRSGVTPAAAMTSLFNIFSRLIKPAGEMKEFLRSIGVASGQAAIQTYGFAQVLAKVAEFAQGKPEILGQLFPDIRGLRGILRLAGDGLQEFQSDLKGVEDSAGATAKAMESFTNNSGKKFQVEMNKVKNYFTETVGTSLVEGIVKISDIFNGLVPVIRAVGNEFIFITGVLGTAALVTRLATLASGLVAIKNGLYALVTGAAVARVALTGLSAVIASNPIIAAAVIIAAGLAAIATAADNVADSYEEANKKADEFYKKANEAGVALTEKALKPLDEAISQQTTSLNLFLAKITKAYDSMSEDMIKKNDELMESFKETHQAFANYLSDSLSSIRSNVNKTKDTLKDIDKFQLTGQMKIDERIRKIQLDEADSAIEKQKLLNKELAITTEEMNKETDRDKQNALYEKAQDIVTEIHKLDREQEKEGLKNTKERTKLIAENKKLQLELAEIAKKQSIADLEKQKKINSASKKGTVVTQDGKIISPTGVTQNIIEEKDQLGDEQRKQRIEEIKQKIKENEEALKATNSTYKKQNDLVSDLKKLKEQMLKLDEERKKLEAEHLKELERQEDILKQSVKDAGKAYSAIEKVKFDKLVDPNTTDKQFKEILQSGYDAVESLSKITQGFAGKDYAKRAEYEQELVKVKESLEATAQQASKRRALAEVATQIDALNKTQQERRKKLLEEMNERRKLVAGIQTSIATSIPAIETIKSYLDEEYTRAGGLSSRAPKERETVNKVLDIVNKITTGQATAENFNKLRELQIEVNRLAGQASVGTKRRLEELYNLIGDITKREAAVKEQDKKIAALNSEISGVVKSIDDLTKTISEKFGIDLGKLFENSKNVTKLVTNTDDIKQILIDGFSGALEGLSPEARAAALSTDLPTAEPKTPTAPTPPVIGPQPVVIEDKSGVKLPNKNEPVAIKTSNPIPVKIVNGKEIEVQVDVKVPQPEKKSEIKTETKVGNLTVAEFRAKQKEEDARLKAEKEAQAKAERERVAAVKAKAIADAKAEDERKKAETARKRREQEDRDTEARKDAIIPKDTIRITEEEGIVVRGNPDRNKKPTNTATVDPITGAITVSGDPRIREEQKQKDEQFEREWRIFERIATAAETTATAATQGPRITAEMIAAEDAKKRVNADPDKELRILFEQYKEAAGTQSKESREAFEEWKKTANIQSDANEAIVKTVNNINTATISANASLTTQVTMLAGIVQNMATGSVSLPPKPITKAFGGMIHGSDNIPALLSRGEFVVNAGATRRFYSQLVAMNGVRGYANGGLVTNVGDINVNMQSSGNTQADIVAIGKGLRREIRRGRIKLN